MPRAKARHEDLFFPARQAAARHRSAGLCVPQGRGCVLGSPDSWIFARWKADSGGRVGRDYHGFAARTEPRLILHEVPARALHSGPERSRSAAAR
jgi:hypothetical protein